MASATTTTNNASASQGNASTIIPFTYGLNGVDITVDNNSSSSLYTLIGILCFIVVSVRLFQLGSSHLRTITSFTATPEQQRYWMEDPTTWWPWLKRNLIWAPLRHKRHNREMQLSAAVSMGTIPGRLPVLLLSMFVFTQLVYLLILDWHAPNPAQITAELRGRSGHLSTLNMIILFLLAGRNNPFIRILRVSFDTFNLFHRWIGRIIIIEALIHTFAWGTNKYQATGWDGVNASLTSNPFIQYGTTSIVAMVIILLQSPSPVRHAFYETFLHLHQLLAFLILVGLLMHARLGNLPQKPFVAFIICIWCYDRIARAARLIYYNVSWRHGLSRVTVEALPGEACRVTFHMPRAWAPPAGAHVYAYLPGVSFWQSHPFSIAWSSPTSTLATSSLAPSSASSSASSQTTLVPQSDMEKGLAAVRRGNGTSVSLVMLVRSGMTRRLYERARAAPRHRLHTTGLLEGPYGALESLSSYGTIVLFAGGIGITHNLPLIRDLLTKHHRRTAAVRKVVLVWSIRTVEALEWVRPFMDELLRMEGRREALKIQIFVTRPRDPSDVVSASDRVQMRTGRADPKVVVRQEFEERVGAMCVGVCGPGVFADEVRDAARKVVEEGKVDFWEEGFTW